ncbi:50S ribosomal protein L1 [Erysipelothrix sp. HDW6B]|uniref:50S ribosomal protein L1 n=1 Tax=Erysipelothrix TaxID=1647 RepID=UPI00135C44C4|nr:MULTISPECIES: 50S ribosomal protein L1 [Erysipelothrix]QIK87051.1 50S ribosomal protein L1 [Erysipelothrix sp. HDW6B]
MAKKTKNYKKVGELVDRSKVYTIEEALKTLREANFVKFDPTVEISYNLNVDPRHADQQIRGAMVLPHGTGRSQKVLVVTQGAKEQEAKDAGADFVGGKEILEEVKNGWFDFDVIVATPDMMGELGKLGRVLGPKGLMPNPKTGTVTMDVTKAVEEIKKGKIEYRVDKESNINTIIGKLSFDDSAIIENFKALNDTIVKARPAAVKGTYIKNLVITTTMGPGLKVAID